MSIWKRKKEMSWTNIAYGDVIYPRLETRFNILLTGVFSKFIGQRHGEKMYPDDRETGWQSTHCSQWDEQLRWLLSKGIFFSRPRTSVQRSLMFSPPEGWWIADEFKQWINDEEFGWNKWESEWLQVHYTLNARDIILTTNGVYVSQLHITLHEL